MVDVSEVYLAKAVESLAGAESEFANRRYNNCANRCYYACFQAAVGDLSRAGIQPSRGGGQWSHVFVPAHFDGQLINRRKLYPPGLRGVLGRVYAARQMADYDEALVTRAEASHALHRARALVEAVLPRGGRAS